MFDPSVFVVAGVPLITLVFGLVEFFKSVFSMEGKPVTVLSACLGVVTAVAFQLKTGIPVDYAAWLEVVVVGLAFGLAASGFYKFLTARFPKE